MRYDYQGILREKIEKDPEFAKAAGKIREERKKIVGKEVGSKVSGDIDVGRPILGGAEFVLNFRILRMMGLKWNLACLLGQKASDGLVYSIGVSLGRDLVLSGTLKGKDAQEFITNCSNFIEKIKIGFVSVVEWREDFPNIIKVDECISCAGMLNVGEPICHYEGGLLAGALSEYFKALIVANEVLCWGHGEETCQFEFFAK